MVIIDTDILIDAGRGDHTAISCLEQIDVIRYMGRVFMDLSRIKI
jgi:hypothetical protein